MLTLRCPYCGHEHADDYELLDHERADMLRCESPQCQRRFAFLVQECPECEEESVFTWKSMPAPEILALLSCNQCGAPFDDAASEGQGPDSAQQV